MKRLIVILFLSGCYSFKDDCYHGMTTICNGEVYPLIAHYQKPYSLGKTNVEERWIDAESCNGYRPNKRFKLAKLGENNDGYLPTKQPNDVKIQGEAYKFMNCMKIKGYVYIEECERKNSKIDKGFCNE